MRRRDFLRLGAGLLGGLAQSAAGARRARGAETGLVDHVLPTVSSTRVLVKVSFTTPLAELPELVVGPRRVRGRPTDTQGLFFAFDADHLAPGRQYRLRLRVGRRDALDPWPLATFPPANARPRRFRLLAYTCAGGHDVFGLYVPTPVRQRLLRRALAFRPDAVVANGDHVYWDLRAGLAALVTGASRRAAEVAGVFDRTAPVLGHANEGVLKRAAGPQIAGLYGTMLRSLPVFFLRDDHDYSEDDQVTPELTTFPADPFMRALARATQWLWYPEFLPDRHRPRDLPGSSAADRPPGVSESFGTLRYGRLVEALLSDCKGYLAVGGADATVVPPAVEAWLLARMADPRPRWVVNIPSNPPGWSAGKYAEWYPDVVGDDRRLTTATPKPGWQPGWLAQHDRLLVAAAAMRRLPLFVSGDIHGLAEGRILRSGPHDFGPNAIVSLITGTPGTGVGWPSLARGTLAMPPEAVRLEEVVPVQEVNGFHLLDFEPTRVTIRHFRWNARTDPADAIDTLAPFHVSVHARRPAPATPGATA